MRRASTIRNVFKTTAQYFQVTKLFCVGKNEEGAKVWDDLRQPWSSHKLQIFNHTTFPKLTRSLVLYKLIKACHNANLIKRHFCFGTSNAYQIRFDSAYHCTQGNIGQQHVLSVQKELSGSGPIGRLRLME